VYVALKQSDIKSFGYFMHETHEGLQKDYEVSCIKLDYLVDFVKSNLNVYGARMMGGEFGGCTVNLIEPESVNHICSMVS
jgi:galactokinase